MNLFENNALADEARFLQSLSQELYGIPNERVLGSAVRSDFITDKNGGAQFVRSYHILYINNWEAKARLIKRIIGKKPLLAAGNTNGDQHILTNHLRRTT